MKSAQSSESRDQNLYLFHFQVSNEAPIQAWIELEINYSSNTCLTIIESNNFKTGIDTERY